MKKKGLIGGVAAAVLIVVALVTVLFCTERIPAGYVGVVYNMNGGVDGEVLTQGWHVVAPTKKVTTYSIGIEQSYLTAADKGDSPNDESFSIPTSDGKTVRVNLEFSYRFDVERVAQTFTMLRKCHYENTKILWFSISLPLPTIHKWFQVKGIIAREPLSANKPKTSIPIAAMVIILWYSHQTMV